MKIKSRNQAFCSVLIISALCGLPCIAQSDTLGKEPSKSIGIDFRTLIDQGIYWYHLYRFNLANQNFNKVLLINPNHAEALKWKGLIDINVGQVSSANVWLNQLQQLHGKNNPHTIELQQVISLSTTKRQKLIEIEDAVDKGLPSQNWFTQLKNLFDNKPLGEAAIIYYNFFTVLNESQKQEARQEVKNLIKQFPNDKRYLKLLSDLGSKRKLILAKSKNEAIQQPTIDKPTPKKSTKKQTPIIPKASLPAEKTEQKKVEPKPAISDFEKAQKIAAQAKHAQKNGGINTATQLLKEAIDLEPSYAWFRFELAKLYCEQNTPENNQLAQNIMREGREKNPEDADMLLASALIEEQLQNRHQALAYLSSIPNDEQNKAMRDAQNRIALEQRLTQLRQHETQNEYNQLANALENTDSRWRNEPQIVSFKTEIEQRITKRAHVGWQSSAIQGSPGVSSFNADEFLFELQIPSNAEQRFFFRADQFKADAGDYTGDPNYSNLTRFGTLGTLTRATLQNGQTNPAVLPTSFFQRKNQSYEGLLTAIGWQNEHIRVDLGKPTGNFPVKTWLGGIKWQTNINDTSIELDLSRRMVLDSVLSATGAIDPLTGETWGGARRTGLKAVSYTAFNHDKEFIGIFRLNQITGKSIPKNYEQSLQLILKHSVFKTNSQYLKIGVSGMLWQFQHNLGQFTFGQGGYYSPELFQSLTFPIEWSGQHQNWSWQLTAEYGHNRAHIEQTNLYPGRANIEQAVASAFNPTQQNATTSASDRYGLSLAIEKKLTHNWVAGLESRLDRSENYAPDTTMLYLKYNFDAENNVSWPPKPITPYSRF